jgi:small GTP-binding protein
MSRDTARIKEIEDELKKAKYNKATEKAFGVRKAQLAKLKEKVEKRAGVGKGSHGWSVQKSGDATVVLLGLPSVGKSTVLGKVTGKESKVGAYEFTTLDVVPGTLIHNDAKIQILDVPGIVSGASAGKGRGREILSMVRAADLIIILVDALHPEQYNVIMNEVNKNGIRLNQERPDIKITKKSRGGMSINTTVKLDLDLDTVEAILKEFRLNNSDVVIRSKVDIDGLIDAIEGNRIYIPAITVVNKVDLVSDKQLEKIKRKLKPDVLISAEKGENIEEFKEAIFGGLRFVRIFLKEVNKQPDLDEPLILRAPVSIDTVCRKLHKDFVKKFKLARVWGKSAKFPGQQFRKLDKALQDGDIVEIHLN